jgi:hypothetical protein
VCEFPECQKKKKQKKKKKMAGVGYNPGAMIPSRLAPRSAVGLASQVRTVSSMATPAEIFRAVTAKATIIDLRTAAEFSEEPMVDGALHVEWDREKESMAEVQLPDRPVVLY